MYTTPQDLNINHKYKIKGKLPQKKKHCIPEESGNKNFINLFTMN